MGFHALDIIVIVGIALLIFGPRTLQSLSHTAGRSVGQAKETKDKLLAELPMEDLARVKETVSQIPLSPQQAAQKLVTSALLPDTNKPPSSQNLPEESSQGQE